MAMTISSETVSYTHLDVYKRQLLYRWRKEYLGDSVESFPGQGKMKASDEEVARLRREVALLREERELLKKAVVFFSKESR